jgi:hypothetical protein
MIVTFQQLRTRFALITIDPHRFCSLQNYFATLAQRTTPLRQSFANGITLVKSRLGHIEAMACSEASSHFSPRLTECCAIPPMTISTTKYWRRAYVYSVAVSTTKMHFDAQMEMQEWRVAISGRQKGELLLDRIELTS